ncbi:MAG TPA: hypothetical protein VK745_32415 [Polyangiaceae bacterium]|nr:hypothetical protein [Polyangiaceae bacterium]
MGRLKDFRRIPMRLRLFVTLFAVGMASSALVVEPRVAEGKDKSADKPAPTGVGALDKVIGIPPKGLHWDLTLEGVAKLYDKVFEDEYLPLLKKAEPGNQMTALEDELKSKQGILRRGRIEFGNIPTGVDQSPLKGEYSYRNGESMASLRLRSGTERHFFFFSDKLWKVYDEHKLTKGGTLGENFQEAIKILEKRFGAPGKLVPANYDKGQPFDEVQWRDPEKVIRAVDLGPILGMVYASKTYVDNIAQYRKNQPEDLHEMDKDVAAATAHPPTDPSKPNADKDKAAKDKPKK